MSGRVRAGTAARRRGLARSLALVVALPFVLSATGCTVGSGAGCAVGSLFVTACNESSARATAAPYSLTPSFFAGEPIEDVCPPPGSCPGPHMNRLTIRLQHTGNRIEVNDTLYVDVENSLQVAECMRGELKNGVPQWDTRLVTAPDGTPIPNLPWCDWRAVAGPDPVGAATCGANAGATDAGGADAAPASDGGGVDAAPTLDGGAAGAPDAGGAVVMTATHPRINLSTLDYVRASLVPLYSCDEARSVGIALPGSWIEFQNFGSAMQTAELPGDFKVNFGERLRATFHLVLGDEAVEYAIQNHDFVPTARIGGALDGYFDFDLQRGRAAQPFP